MKTKDLPFELPGDPLISRMVARIRAARAERMRYFRLPLHWVEDVDTLVKRNVWQAEQLEDVAFRLFRMMEQRESAVHDAQELRAAYDKLKIEHDQALLDLADREQEIERLEGKDKTDGND